MSTSPAFPHQILPPLLLTFLQTLFLLTFLLSPCLSLDHEMVYLVDYYNQNLLFRTGDPTNSTSLDYTSLIKSFRIRAKEDNVSFPTQQFYLVQYSLLDWEKGREPDAMKLSMRFYQENPHLGRLMHYRVIGDNLKSEEPLYQLYGDDIIEQYPRVSKDQLHLLAGQVRKELVTQTNIAKIIFFHCERGRSRAGIVFGAYNMMFHKWTYPESYQAAGGMPYPKNSYLQALNWFCWYWQSHQNGTFNYQCDKYYNVKQQNVKNDGTVEKIELQQYKQQQQIQQNEELEQEQGNGFKSLICSVTGLLCNDNDTKNVEQRQNLTQSDFTYQQQQVSSGEDDAIQGGDQGKSSITTNDQIQQQDDNGNASQQQQDQKTSKKVIKQKKKKSNSKKNEKQKKIKEL